MPNYYTTTLYYGKPILLYCCYYTYNTTASPRTPATHSTPRCSCAPAGSQRRQTAMLLQYVLLCHYNINVLLSYTRVLLNRLGRRPPPALGSLLMLQLVGRGAKLLYYHNIMSECIAYTILRVDHSLPGTHPVPPLKPTGAARPSARARRSSSRTRVFCSSSSTRSSSTKLPWCAPLLLFYDTTILLN